MDFEEAFYLADRAVFKQTGEHLSDREKIVLDGAWKNLSYEQIAKEAGYTGNYLQRDVGAKLWRKLSEALGETVKKSNFQAALERWRSQYHPSTELEYPDGPVRLGDQFYVERQSMEYKCYETVESKCYETVLRPGSLLRIKAPRFMGKTSLIDRVLNHADSHHCRTVKFDLGSLERKVLEDLDRFLQEMCHRVGQKLDLKNQLQEYWDEMFSATSNCTDYFEKYLLPESNDPLVLGLDNVDRIFSYPVVAEDFLGMLRSWYEKGKNEEIWQSLHLIVAHSTDVYFHISINRSPFNVGEPIDLLPFTSEQIKDLAQRYQLNELIGTPDFNDLQELVGGHPYLLRLAFYHLRSSDQTFAALLEKAATETGIYHNELLKLWNDLQQAPELANALKTVVNSSEPVELGRIESYKLRSMGLVKVVSGDRLIPSCELYRLYFRASFQRE